MRQTINVLFWNLFYFFFLIRELNTEANKSFLKLFQHDKDYLFIIPQVSMKLEASPRLEFCKYMEKLLYYETPSQCQFVLLPHTGTVVYPRWHTEH